MYMRKFLLLACMLFCASFVFAETDDEKIRALEARIQKLEQQLAAASQGTGSLDTAEIRRQLEILAAEVEKLRSGEEEQIEVTESERQALGLGSSAATVYTRR